MLFPKLTLVLLVPDKSCFFANSVNPNQLASSVYLIWICTVCHAVCEFVSTTWIKKSYWLIIISGLDILIYSAWKGLK